MIFLIIGKEKLKNKMPNKKYLITGITGFVGSHLTNLLLEQGNIVYGFSTGGDKSSPFYDVVSEADREKVEFLRGDMRDQQKIDEIFQKERFDGVFHFAAQSHSPTSFDGPVQTFETNTNGTVYLVEAIRNFQPECAMVYASSGEVYGKVPEEQQPITEETPLAPKTPYGVSKLASELFIRERVNSCGLKIVIGRGFASTGPGRPRRFSISSDAAQISEIVASKKESILDVGNIRSKRGLMDVRDCVKAYSLLMDSVIENPTTRGEAYNVASEFSKEIEEYIDIMLKLRELQGIEKRVDSSKLRRGTKPSIQLCDTSKIRNLTGWSPQIPINQTLQDLLTYWDNKIK